MKKVVSVKFRWEDDKIRKESIRLEPQTHERLRDVSSFYLIGILCTPLYSVREA